MSKTFMGSNLALNIAEKGNKIAVFNRTPEKTDEFYESAGDLKKQIIPCKTIEEFVEAIRPPRPIIIMKKGLDILAKGNVIQGTDQLLSADSQKQKEDLFSEFFANPSMTPEAAQKRFAEIIASAD